MVHFSVADAGFDNIHVEHVQFPPALPGGGGLRPAADQSKAFTGVVFPESELNVNAGNDDSAFDNACSRASFSAGDGMNVETTAKVNVKRGKEPAGRARTVAFGSEVFATTICWEASSSDLSSGAASGEGTVSRIA